MMKIYPLMQVILFDYVGILMEMKSLTVTHKQILAVLECQKHIGLGKKVVIII